MIIVVLMPTCLSQTEHTHHASYTKKIIWTVKCENNQQHNHTIPLVEKLKLQLNIDPLMYATVDMKITAEDI
jgi:hypothetical protein